MKDFGVQPVGVPGSSQASQGVPSQLRDLAASISPVTSAGFCVRPRAITQDLARHNTRAACYYSSCVRRPTMIARNSHTSPETPFWPQIL